MIPKVGCAGDIYAVDALVTSIEMAKQRTKPINFEVIIEPLLVWRTLKRLRRPARVWLR